MKTQALLAAFLAIPASITTASAQIQPAAPSAPPAAFVTPKALPDQFVTACQLQIQAAAAAATGTFDYDASPSNSITITQSYYNGFTINSAKAVASGPEAGGAEGGRWVRYRVSFQSTPDAPNAKPDFTGTALVTATRGGCILQSFRIK